MDQIKAELGNAMRRVARRLTADAAKDRTMADKMMFPHGARLHLSCTIDDRIARALVMLAAAVEGANAPAPPSPPETADG